MNQQGVILTDPTIVQYFSSNPHIDPNTMVVLFIDILKQLSTNLSTSINNANITQLITRITELSTSVASIRTDVNNTIRDQSSKVENIILKDRESLGGILSEKTSSAMAVANRNIQDILTQSNERQKTTLHGLQQDIKQLLSTTDDRSQRDIRSISDQLTSQCRSQDALNTELTGFLNKYKNNSSVKGNVSEKELYSILQNIFPRDELVVSSKSVASCDICVNRADPAHPSILFENKDYSTSVDKDEIKKFERDLHTQKKHGVFISQNSPISMKGNFHIDIIDGLIHLYLPNANYDADRIKIAVDIIDHLSQKIIPDMAVGDIRISHTELAEILQEYKNFANRKIRLLEGIRSNTKLWTEELEAMAFPRIQTLLIHTGNLEKCELTCSYCMTFTGKNKASLGAHMKSCKLIAK